MCNTQANTGAADETAGVGESGVFSALAGFTAT
jgi:hypothetical protein